MPNLPDNALADESWKRLEEIAQYWRLQAEHARKLVRALRRSPAGGEAVEVVARQHIPGCPLSEVSIELASCPCAIDDTGIIAAVLAHVSAEGGMLKVDVSAARAAIEALTRLGAGVGEGARTFKLGDRVTKKSGSQWTGKIVGWYSTVLTPEGYAVESDSEIGSVQIYPAAALRPCASPSPESAPTDSMGEG